MQIKLQVKRKTRKHQINRVQGQSQKRNKIAKIDASSDAQEVFTLCKRQTMK